MEQGIYGFPPGKNVTVDVQLFDKTGFTDVWIKPKNAKICFVEGSGGGQGGGGSSGAGVAGGSAGVAYQILLLASGLSSTEQVVIGAGGLGGIAGTGAEGGDTTFAGYYWAGGRNGGSAARNAYTGIGHASSWGMGGPGNTAGRQGSFGAGGGGGGGGAGGAGRAGGAPRTFRFGVTTSAETGGGASGGTVSSPAGADANPLNDVDGYGEGAGGGYGGTGGVGGNGRRGSGGGGGGNGTFNGGNGGDGFLKIVTYCWE